MKSNKWKGRKCEKYGMGKQEIVSKKWNSKEWDSKKWKHEQRESKKQERKKWESTNVEVGYPKVGTRWQERGQ